MEAASKGAAVEDRIVELLGAGLAQSVVAESVGVDASYVSQLVAREDIAARVATLRAQKAAEFVEHDTNIHTLEKLALERIGKMLPLTSDVMKLTKVFQVLNGARRSMDHGIAQQQATPATVVNITLPPAAQLHFKLTPDRQVIEIEGRSMVPMPSHQVAAQLRAQKAARLLEHSKEEPRMPVMSSKTKSLIESI